MIYIYFEHSEKNTKINNNSNNSIHRTQGLKNVTTLKYLDSISKKSPSNIFIH